MKIERIEIANRIRTQRESRHLTREAFEELSGISAKYLFEIEMAQKDFTTAILLKICQALELNPDYILLGKTSPMDDAIRILEKMDEKNLRMAVAVLRTILVESEKTKENN